MVVLSNPEQYKNACHVQWLVSSPIELPVAPRLRLPLVYIHRPHAYGRPEFDGDTPG